MTPLPRHTDVLIVGAGPTGLVLGIRLRQCGIDCTVIDRLADPLPWSRAIGLHARTLEICHALGIIRDVQRQASEIRHVTVHNEAGALFALDLNQLDAPYPGVLSLPQTEFESILAERYLALGGRLIRAASLESFQQQDDGVLCQVSGPGDGAAEEEQIAGTVHCQILAGCDGAHSFVRERLGLEFDGINYPDHFLLADVQPDWAMAKDSSHAFLLPDGMLVALPLPDGWRLIMDESLARDTDEDSLDIAPFAERMTEALGPRAPALGEPVWMSRFSVQRRLARQYRQNRVLLAGDACHVQSPLGAQGMNTGIADAFNLAWKVALYLGGVGGGPLLDSYQLERRPVAADMLRRVDFLSRATMARSQFVRMLRDRLLSFLDRHHIPWGRLLRRISQLDVSYRHSPLVATGPAWLDARHRRLPHPGDRFAGWPFCLPDSGQRMSVFDLSEDPRHYLFIQVPDELAPADLVAIYALADRVPAEFGAYVRTLCIVPEQEVDELAELRDFDVTRVRDQGHWADAAPSGALWLLRPDGHLAYVGLPDDADHLLHWLADFFAR